MAYCAGCKAGEEFGPQPFPDMAEAFTAVFLAGLATAKACEYLSTELLPLCERCGKTFDAMLMDLMTRSMAVADQAAVLHCPRRGPVPRGGPRTESAPGSAGQPSDPDRNGPEAGTSKDAR